MRGVFRITQAVVTTCSLVLLTACGESQASGEPDNEERIYDGVQIVLLGDDLVNVVAQMHGDDVSEEDLIAYTDCAIARHAIIKNHGFARHVRTKVANEGGVWSGDAVYTISPALPRGFRMIDAEVVNESCAENGIPTV